MRIVGQNDSATGVNFRPPRASRQRNVRGALRSTFRFCWWILYRTFTFAGALAHSR